MPEYALCRHIKTNGRRCQSPSLNGKSLCFFHTRLMKQHRSLQKSPQFQPVFEANALEGSQNTSLYASPRADLDLPPLEDPESIQLAISLVLAAVATSRVDTKRAHLLLYGLQLASANVRAVNTEPYAPSVVRTALLTKSGQNLAPPDDYPHVTVAPARLEGAGTQQVV